VDTVPDRTDRLNPRGSGDLTKTVVYEIALNVPENTPASNPVSTKNNNDYPTLSLPAGQIDGFVITVPSGANGAVFFKIKVNDHTVFPSNSNQNGFSNLTNVVARFIPTNVCIDTNNTALDLEAYNLSSSFNYLILVDVVMEV